MAEVICYQEECVNNLECKCSLDFISLSFNGFVERHFVPCSNYQDIGETAEYQTPYFMAVKNPKTGKAEKKESRGKRVEMLGIVFYTEDDTRHDGNWWLTEEQSGYGMSKEKVLEHPEYVLEETRKMTPVKDLPNEGTQDE